ncbi:MAG: hypothetical protein Q8M95_07080 [Candidatus Methanoperedens sp.]|nr:hypothetical protein [Candidatus Methanoperedens sp.]
MIEKIGYPLVLISMLTIVLVETNILTTGIFITIGLNIAMVLVLFLTLALLHGSAKSLMMFYMIERHPLYSPIRAGWINEQNKRIKRNDKDGD